MHKKFNSTKWPLVILLILFSIPARVHAYNSYQPNSFKDNDPYPNSRNILPNDSDKIHQADTQHIDTIRENKTDVSIANGYWQENQPVLTGSVSSVKAEDLQALPGQFVSNLLQGMVPGVTVTGSGQPGAISKVRIRGFSSFTANDPLYVVDGVPAQEIGSLDPADVESVAVLKDAGAAAIYGSRGSNGVIVITTRKGTPGIRISYSAYAGFQDPGKGPTNLLNAQEYADLQWQVYKNDGTIEYNPLYGLSTNPTPTLPGWAANTNWYRTITHRAGIQNHHLSLSGGAKNAHYYASFGYFNQDGIIIHTWSKRYGARFNTDFTFLHDRITVGENLALAYHTGVGVSNLDENSPIQMGPYRTQSIIPAVITQPITGILHQFVRGEYGGTGIAPRLGNSINEYAALIRAKDNINRLTHVLGSVYLDISLLKGLHLRSTFGGNMEAGSGMDYKPATYENSENSNVASLTEDAFTGNDWNWSNLLVLDQLFGDHRILVLAGYESEKYGSGRYMNLSRSGYFTDDINYRNLNNGATLVGASSTQYTPSRMYSFIAQAKYAFRDKYLLGASIRRDGSSRFGNASRFAIYPAFSAGWRISEEPFFHATKWINELKFRGSYGVTGNQMAVSPMSSYFLFSADVGSSYYDLNGTGNSAVIGYYPYVLANPDIKPESTSILDLGIDAGLLGNSLAFTFDWYKKQSRDILLAEEIPEAYGVDAYYYVNAASMTTTGVDLNLSYRKSWQNTGIFLAAEITAYRNKITDMGSASTFYSGSTKIGSVSRNAAGYPLSAYYGYKVTGLFQNQAELLSAPYQGGAAPGFFRYANMSTNAPYGTQEIDPDDRTYIGNPNPKFTTGLTLGMTWKRLDLTAFLYGSFGNDLFNYNKWFTDFWPSFGGQKSKELLNDSWTQSRPNASVPMASYNSNFSTNTVICSYYIENGSYVRMKDLQLGYTLPEKLLGKTGIRSFRLYMQGVNLFTLTGYSGLDPEITGEDTSFGLDSGNYPNAKYYLIGLQAGF